LGSIKRLRFLNLSHNPLYKTGENIDTIHGDSTLLDLFNMGWSTQETFTSLKTLILNSCYLSQKTLESMLIRLPCLEELHLTANNYSNIAFNENFAQNSIKIIYFNNNILSDWSDVFKLGKCLPNLESLILSENNLADLPGDFQTDLVNQSFGKLQTLNLNKLKIQAWTTIDMIRQLPALKNLRIQHIPLLNQYNEDEKYFLVVSSLNENLIETLNGSKVTSDDIKKCHRNFIRYYMNLNFDRPVRFYELTGKQNEFNGQINHTLDETKVYVKVKLNDKHTFKRLNLEEKVKVFKQNLEGFVHRKYFEFKLYRTNIDLGAEELTDEDSKLCDLNIKNGDEFKIELC